MNKLVYLVLTTLGGGAGWWIGEHIGIMTAYTLSVIGTAMGIYVGRRIIQNYLQ